MGTGAGKENKVSIIFIIYISVFLKRNERKTRIIGEKGNKEEAIAIALEFKKMGLPIADIAKGTGLTVEEIEKL